MRLAVNHYEMSLKHERIFHIGPFRWKCRASGLDYLKVAAARTIRASLGS